jgi:sortase A
MGAIVIGLLCVGVGGADLMSRAVERIGDDALFVAFAPAAALEERGGAATSTATGVMIPARLRVPSLGVNASVESVGTRADGTMGTPRDFDDVSWWSLGAKPGGQGSAVFAGHVNNALMKTGVFQHLSQIKKGDYVTVEDVAGRSLVYRVSSISEYPANASTEELFATDGVEQVVLITCDGEWVPAARTFDKRLVVIAKPAY